MPVVQVLTAVVAHAISLDNVIQVCQPFLVPLLWPEHVDIAVSQALITLLSGQEVPDVAVTLVADRWISDTTSDGAAGLWEVK